MTEDELLDDDLDIDEDEEDGEILQEQPKSSRAAHLKPYQFKKGQSGNPAGRKPGISLKERAKAYLATLTDEEALEYWNGMDKKTVWEMAEGKPDAKIEGDIRVNAASVLFEDDEDEPEPTHEEETPTPDSVVPDLGQPAPVQPPTPAH